MNLNLDEFITEPKEQDFEIVKEILAKEAVQLKEMLEEQAHIDHQLTKLKSEIHQLKEKIRHAWLPFVKGADKANMNLNGVELEMKKHLEVSIAEAGGSKDEAIEWFMNNGFKGVCKWDVHTQTLKKIAREEFEKGTQIPGLEYKDIQLLKIK